MSRPHPHLLVLALVLALAGGAPANAAERPTPSPAAAVRALDAARETLRTGPDDPQGRDEATLALRDLAIALPALRGADRRQARSLLGRPSEEGTAYHFGPEDELSPDCNGRFCVHWSSRERNEPSPWFVDRALAAATRSANIQTGELGWRAPRSDGARGARNGRGGEGQTDIYLTDLGEGLYGYATTDPGQAGSRQHAYLVLDNDYRGYPSRTRPINLMKATLAHEHNHVIQFAYDRYQEDWMLESTATWMEPEVFPRIDDYLNFLAPFADRPEAPMTGHEKVYASATWNHWLSSRLGRSVVREAWAASVSTRPSRYAVGAYEAAIDGAGGRSFSREFARFAATTAEWSSSDAFPDSERYPQVRRESLLGRGKTSLRLDNTAYRLFDVAPRGGPVRLAVRARRGVRSSFALVARRGPRDAGKLKIVSRYLPRGGKGRLELRRPRRFDRITALAINADGRRGFSGRYEGDGAGFTLARRR